MCPMCKGSMAIIMAGESAGGKVCVTCGFTQNPNQRVIASEPAQGFFLRLHALAGYDDLHAKNEWDIFQESWLNDGGAFGEMIRYGYQEAKRCPGQWVACDVIVTKINRFKALIGMKAEVEPQLSVRYWPKTYELDITFGAFVLTPAQSKVSWRDLFMPASTVLDPEVRR